MSIMNAFQRICLLVLPALVVPFLLGATAITLTQPTSGNLTVGHPQQPSGTVTSQNQGDWVNVSHMNYGNGNFNFGDHSWDEYWNQDFQNNGWSTDDDFSFTLVGTWSLVAVVKNNQNQVRASTGAGGAVVQ